MSKRSLFWLFLVGTIAACGYRYFEVLKMIEPETGFYYPKYEFSGMLVSLMMLVFALALLLLGKFNNHTPDRPLSSSKLVGSAAFVMAIASFFLAFSTATQDSFFSVSGALDIKEAVLLLFALLLGVFFCAYGLCLFMRKKMPRALCIIPVIFAGYRLAIVFLSYFELSKIPSVLLETFTLVFALLFWHMFSKYTAKIKFKSTISWLAGTAYAAAFFALVDALPNIILYFSNRSLLLRVPHNLYFDFCTALFAVILVATAFSHNKSGRVSKRHNSISDVNGQFEQEVPLHANTDEI